MAGAGDDGLGLNLDALAAKVIREEMKYGGVRLKAVPPSREDAHPGHDWHRGILFEYGYHNYSVWLSYATLRRFAYLLGVELGVVTTSIFRN